MRRSRGILKESKETPLLAEVMAAGKARRNVRRLMKLAKKRCN